MKQQNQPIIHFVFALLAIVFAILNVYAVKALIIFGSPLLFSVAVLVEVVLIGVFIYCVIRSLMFTHNIITSIWLSLLGGLAQNEYVLKIRNSKSPVVRWLLARFRKESAVGLPLTITLVIAAYFFINFLMVLVAVRTRGLPTQVDTRIMNLIPSVRTPLQNTFFRAVTMLANPESAVLLIILIASLLWFKRQRLLAGFVILVAAGEEASVAVFKHIIHRPRPERALALYDQTSFSFPSGHAAAATVLFGLVAYITYKSYVSVRARILTIAAYVLSVFLVAGSRVYLGVHNPTDVWGSILLGSAILSLAVGSMEIASRYSVFGLKKIVVATKIILIAPLVLIIFAVLAAPHVIHFQSKSSVPSTRIISPINESNIHSMPLYSETLTGAHMEPINFVYVGSEQQITTLFARHGWQKADPSTLGNTLKAVAVAFQGRQYPAAPVTPSYLNSNPESLAFEKSTELNTLRQRHHTRLWQTGYVYPDGRHVWVATASFDEGVELAGSAKLPTHHIDPNIDAERAYIIQSLGLPEKLIPVVLPQLGKNASGDEFFTDGKAEVMEFSVQ